MKYLFSSLALAAAIFTSSAHAETINCTEITAIPMVITVQGVYCLKGNLASSLTVGNMIDIQTNNVIIDFNGFKLGGLAGGAGTNANGIFALNRKNITLRNGAIRGFLQGIFLDQNVVDTSSGHLIEDMLLDGNRSIGIQARGSGLVVRRNRVVNTGPGSIFTFAIGIYVLNARNTVIADNVISGTSESTITRGIYVSDSALIEVHGNIVLDTRDASIKLGIDINNGNNVTLIGNRILNDAGTGIDGIGDSGNSTNVKCIDNTITGYATALFRCDVAVGNN